MGLIFNGNGDVIKAVDGSLTVQGLDLGGGTNVNAGIGTFSDLKVTGTLTYEDVKNVDSVGIISARQSIHVGYGVSAAGIITATSYRGDGSQLTGISAGVTAENSAPNNTYSSNTGGSLTSNSEKNTLYGDNAGTAINTGDLNVCLGYNAGASLAAGYRNVVIGANAGDSINFTTSTVVGYEAATGSSAAFEYSAIFGYGAGHSATSSYSVLIGRNAGGRHSGNNNTIVGDSAGNQYATYGQVTGEKNVILGAQAGAAVLAAEKNTILGFDAGDALTTGSNNIIIGNAAAASAVGTSNEITLGDTNITNFRIPGIGLTVTSEGLNLAGAAEFTGIVTASSYRGDGSQLTGITGTTINNNANNRLITGSGTANTLEGESTLTYDGTNLDVAGDNKPIRLGASQDLKIYHSGSHNYVYAQNSGQNVSIIAQSGLINLQPVNNEEGIIIRNNGAVELYHDNVKKLETASWGVDITGDCRATELKLEDTHYLSIGSGNDLRLRHDGSNSYITNTTGALHIRNDGIYFKNAAGSENFIDCSPNAEVSLFYDNSKKLETHSWGVKVFNDLIIPDSGIIRLGSSTYGDLKIYHDGNNSYVEDAGTGSLILKTGRVSFNDTSNNEMGRFDSDGLKFNGDSSAANAVDDYERGTFTPKIYYGTGTSEPSYSWRYGNYIKVGKQVTVWFNIGITGFNPSNTQQVHIANLPFQHNDPNSGQWKYLNLMFGYSWASGWGFNSGSNNQMFIAIYDNETKARIVKHEGAHIYTDDVGSGQRFSSYFSYQTDS